MGPARYGQQEVGEGGALTRGRPSLHAPSQHATSSTHVPRTTTTSRRGEGSGISPRMTR